MIALALVNAALLAWLIYLTYQGKQVKGLLTANYIALKRINKILEVVQSEEWKKYTVPFESRDNK